LIAKIRNSPANPQVAAVFDAYPKAIRQRLLFLRRVIFDVASQTDGVGALEETLKWGQPSYLTTASKSGSLIRIDRGKSPEGSYAMYFHCQTTLVDTFRGMFRDELRFEGSRAIVFGPCDRVPLPELRQCIALALTYRLGNKRAGKR
jgi:Domain of unknown function (DU1801)